jgi:hypothetical protein
MAPSAHRNVGQLVLDVGWAKSPCKSSTLVPPSVTWYCMPLLGVPIEAQPKQGQALQSCIVLYDLMPHGAKLSSQSGAQRRVQVGVCKRHNFCAHAPRT